jgi:phage tail protein X
VSARKITVTQGGITLSRLVWTIFRSAQVGLVERVIELNPLLPTDGMFIPAGTEVIVDSRIETKPTRAVIKLWD